MPRYALFKDGKQVVSGELRTMSDAWRFAFQFNATVFNDLLATLKIGYSIKQIPEVDND